MNDDVIPGLVIGGTQTMFSRTELDLLVLACKIQGMSFLETVECVREHLPVVCLYQIREAYQEI